VKQVFFDLDGVLIDSPGTVENEVMLQTGHPFQCTHYNPNECKEYPEVSRALAMSLFLDTQFLSRIHTDAITQEALKILYLFTEVGIVTARPQDEDSKAATYLQCAREFPFLPWLPYITTSKEKPALLKKLGADYYIEDCLDNANAIAAAGIPCFLIEKRYNQGHRAEGVIPVDNLLQAVHEIITKVIAE